MVLIVGYLLSAGKYSLVSTSMLERWLLVKGICFRQVSIVCYLLVCYEVVVI